MTRRREKSQFFAEETRPCEGLAAQLAAACQEVAELAPTTREVADLRVREKDARDDTHEAKEKLSALIERARTDTMEAERLWKERDDLFRAMEELHMGTKLAGQERAVAQ